MNILFQNYLNNNYIFKNAAQQADAVPPIAFIFNSPFDAETTKSITFATIP